MWQPVLMINGFIMLVLGLMMMVPAFALYYYTGTADYIFVQHGLIAIFLGGALFLSNYGRVQKISILQGYLITVFSWFLAPIVAAFPFIHHIGFNNIADAVFEATAGITATGATILNDIEAEPKSVLLWRTILNGMGGIGIVIFAVALSPFLGTGGMHLFNKENSDTTEKFLPKIRYIANDIIFMYIFLNIICAILLKYLGMNWFDAFSWAVSTVSTGGFSIKNDSIAYYNSGLIEATIALFMLLGSLPITYFVLIMKNKNFSTILNNGQVNSFLKLIFFYILFLSVFYWLSTDNSFLHSFRIIGFNLIAAITTTGIYSSDYLTWGNWSIVVFLILFLHGGCTGSTSGSIKIFRWQVVFAFLKKHISQALSPHQVTVMKTNNKTIDDNIVVSVFALVVSFLFAIIFFTLLLSFLGLDFMTAFGAVVGAITTCGTGLTEAIGPKGNFAIFSPIIKYILAFIMILGRLEVITVFVLLGKFRFK